MTSETGMTFEKAVKKILSFPMPPRKTKKGEQKEDEG